MSTAPRYHVAFRSFVAAALLLGACTRREPPPQPQSPLDRIATASPDEPGESPAPQSRNPTDDPTQDGWSTEVVSSRLNKQLKKLRHLLEVPAELNDAALAKLVADDFAAAPLRPTSLQVVYNDPPIKVERGEAEDKTGGESVHRGRAGALVALRELAEPFRDRLGVRTYFKLFNVEVEAEHALTRQYFAFSGRTNESSVEEHTLWTCRWRLPENQLLSVSVDRFERVTVGSKQQTLFTDCTGSVIGPQLANDPALRASIEHWLRRVESIHDVDPLGIHGPAIGDVNGDHLDDVYLCQSGGMPNLLLIHQPDGSTVESSASSAVDVMDRTSSALLIDLDNDGDQDLVITARETGTVFFENDGSARFKPRRVVRGAPAPNMLAAADYDNDGDLDVYLCFYGSGVPMPYHDAVNGRPNTLLRNNGDYVFEDVAQQAGLTQTSFSYAAAWEDFDNDGDQDLYVANDFGRNNLYRNNGDGTFTDVAGQTGVEDMAAGMSVSWADYDHDGNMDLYVSNMFSSAGNRVTFQRQFKAGVEDSALAGFRRHARGNSLFRSRGDGTFIDVSTQADVTMGRWAWGSHFVDVNNDTREDLVVGNGFVTGYNAKDL